MNLGSITDINVDLKQPISLKASLNKLRELTILVGTNGSGKTFVNLIVFSFTHILNSKILFGSLNKESIEYWIKKTFNNEITGTIAVKYASGAELTLELNNSEVVSYSENISELKITGPQHVVYVSTNFRLLTNWGPYLTIRASLDTKYTGNHPKIVEGLLTIFKIYDIMALEAFIISLPKEISPELKERVHKITGDDCLEKYKMMHIQNNELYFDEEPSSKFGNGHQAVISMNLFI